jgi:SAM-dependent methyltransferase
VAEVRLSQWIKVFCFFFSKKKAFLPAFPKARMETAQYELMDAAEDRMWWYRALHARLRDALVGVRGPVLDAGCGTGGFLRHLAQRAEHDAVGIEYFPPAALRAHRKSGRPVAVGSIAALPFATASFDAAIAADVLCHAAVEPQEAHAELRRVLRPGGRLIVNMPAYRWLLSAHDRRVRNARRQSAGELREMLETAGFAPSSVRYWNGLLLPLMVLRRKLLARRHDSASDVAAFSPWLDATLHAITALERRSGLPMPAGGSVLAIAARP